MSLLIIGGIIGFIIAYFLFKNRFTSEKNNRKKLAGKYTEKFVPFLSGFKYKPEDSFFLGMPIDFVVFDGLSDGYVDSVTFVEVKTGKSQLTAREKSIKEAISQNRIKHKVIRL